MKAQVSLEFIIFTALGIFIVIGLAAVAINYVTATLQDEAATQASDLASVIQQELITASEMHQGYHHELDLPALLKRNDYTITNTDTDFTITQAGLTITLNTPPINGTLIKGTNIINTENGTITITH